LITENLSHYQLLDSGLGRKLEIISGLRVNRASPQAIWKPLSKDAEWNLATSNVIRKKDGGGEWEHKKPPSPTLTFPFEIDGRTLQFRLKFTSFGHCGVFFEQIPVWQWLYEEVKTLKVNLVAHQKL